ncbi:hypothetical protein F5I97DRAFT_1888165 [Phlebopus sp. FC_14]|nr:hypothetical protein F5I97DRAFT_1888165 [Phlebopus sp. FC_14]
MLQFKHFSAWIEVEGKELEQYGVEEDLEKNQVSCWIASQAGKTFSILIKHNSLQMQHNVLVATPTLDGTGHGGKFILDNGTTVLKDTITSPTTVRPYMFSKLQLTDEDKYLNNQQAKHIGEIGLCVWRAEYTGGDTYLPHTRTLTEEKVHERSKKAMSHCVGYGPETRIAKLLTPVHYPDLEPLATFMFKYREENILRANGIIPRPPGNGAAPAEQGEVLDLTAGAVKTESHADEIEALDNAILAMQRKRDALQSKRRNPGGSQPPAKRIKSESKFVPTGEVIDLT